ncbi:MAG: hypothetical protein OXE78_03430 [Gammaproteobacteria bacterium]|nr:hypothetical protein [Gammaproteobacteria bacterium]MCY4358579.1 hypothetical protein [Gammaproteobacteria bacterium]
MNKRLNAYFVSKGAKELDEDVLRNYAASMRKETIPETEKQVRKNEERAAELRFSPSRASRRQKSNVGKR